MKYLIKVNEQYVTSSCPFTSPVHWYTVNPDLAKQWATKAHAQRWLDRGHICDRHAQIIEIDFINHA